MRADDDSELLIACFEKVFPELSRSAIPGTSTETLPAWDSLAQVTLLSLIGEQFSLDIDFEELQGATSYERLLDFVRRTAADGK